MTEADTAPSIRFTAVIQLAGINPYVDVPDETIAQLGLPHRGAVLVALAPTLGALPLSMEDKDRLARIGRLADDGAFRTTLIAMRKTPTRLYLDQYMRRASGLQVGDTAVITLRPDPHDRDLPLPLPLADALAADPQLQAAWEALNPSRRREILTYLNFLKTPAALERNVSGTLRQLGKK